MQINVSGILQRVLKRNPTEADLNYHIGQVCRRHCGDRHAQATRAAVQMIDRHSEKLQCARLDSARQLSQGEATVRSVSAGSIEELPPDVQERVRQMMASGETSHSEVRTGPAEIRTVSWQSGDGGEPPISKEVMRQMGGKRPFTMTFVSKGRLSPLKIVGLLVLLLVVLSGASILKVWWYHRTAGRAKQFGSDVEVVERLYADDPESWTIGLQLAEAYARRLVIVRSMAGMKKSLPQITEGVDIDKEHVKRVEAGIAKIEKLMGVEASEQTQRRTAERGKAVCKKLLASKKLKAQDQTQTWIFLGQFHLGLGEAQEAKQASDKAAALDPKHIAPHILNAEIYEYTEKYQQAIDENRTALSKLSGWINREPTMKQYVIWRLGSFSDFGPIAKEQAWRKKKAEMAKQMRQGIDMHIRTLQLLQKAKQVFGKTKPKTPAAK